ncbi:amino acid ABC transporter permease [Modestobacter sp. VKM Ac-2979]|uniref:amino acid ABC transporter permease n=1 Tax=unclassified Modestobacter TaxID=2643866 RepID=UPI0022ABA7FA|nr:MULTISPECIES: amino acid ABC transporter permease [unclassified Modestobacter]MCZ2811984.1 amino acid ABC transporter permease [Modestobacter sp. VKM Ac-2979]MCZ2843708.1 amino acid ABC transporter permease [Modestobacter sp. VKM Ac-2980]
MPPSLSQEELTVHSDTVDPVVVPLRHHGRNSVAAVAVLAVLLIGYGFVSNPYIDWSIVGDFLVDGSILEGLSVTLQLTVISITVGLIFAVILAVMRVSDSRVLRGIAWAYSFVFRGIPMIVLLILVGNLGLFVQELRIGVPFTDITFYSVRVQSVFTPFVASVVALVLVAAAYMAEIVRGGILSVQRWQYAAAKALGLNGMQTLRYVVLPQAMRVIIPPLGNEVVNTVKATALVAVIAGGDLLTIAQSISGVNYKVIELLIVATIWYLLVISLWSGIQYFIERKTAEK